MGHRRALGIGLLQGPRRVRFFMREVPLHMALERGGRSKEKRRVHRGTSLIRNRTPPGPYSRSMPRALQWS